MPWIGVWKAFRDPALPAWARWLPVLALVYTISPLDFVPDLIPVVGWLDDLGIGATSLAVTLAAVLKHAERLKQAAPRP